jgi:hypothetical protein
MQDTELDQRIGALQAQLLAAQGTDQVGLVLELTDVLAVRYQSRMAAGDLAGALDDLGESVARLEDALAIIGPGHPCFPDVVLDAGMVRGERWSIHGDTADRDGAIGHFTGLLAVPSAATPDLPAIHGLLARLLGSRSGDTDRDGSQQEDDLNAAIRHAQAGLATARAQARDAAMPDAGGIADPEVIIELHAVLGLALSYRSVAAREWLGSGDSAGIAAARADRDNSIVHLDWALEALPGDDPVRLDVADALGRMRHDCYDDPWPGALAPDPADLDAAIHLLQQVATGEPDPRSLWYLVLALSDRIDLLSAPADLDALITTGRLLLDHPDAAGADTTDLHDYLGCALLDRADATVQGSRADLDAAITHLEVVLAATAPEDASRMRLLVQLTQACWQRLDGDASRYDEVDTMIRYARQAWRLRSPADELPAEFGCYLAVGLHEQLRRPGVPFDIDAVNLGIDALTQTEPLVADEPGLHLCVVVLLGFFLVSRAQFAGSVADLQAAQPWLLRAADELPPGDPQFADFTQLLAVGLFTLALLGMTADHIDRAIDLLAASVQSPIPETDRATMTRGALGLALVQRAGFTQSGQDLDDGIAHLAAAFEAIAAGDADRISMAWNLGSALLIRFLHTGDVQDQDAARFYLGVMDQADDKVRELMSDFDVTRTAMRGLLRLSEGIGGDQGALDDAVENLRAALDMVPAGHPYQGRIRSDFGLALFMRGAHRRGTTAELQEAARELTAAIEALPPGHIMRPLAVMRLGVSLATSAYFARDPRLLREAIGHLAGALGEVDPKSGVRVRLVGELGIAHECLHQLTGDPADIEAAAGWLTQACREFDDRPGHPLHAGALTRLAHVRRIQGDNPGARAAGLAALRAHGREVLLQTGTARSLGFARIAASQAIDVASWCLDDGQPAAAVDALELGRGLILHAATSVADVPAMLIEAGRADLAKAWQKQQATHRDLPWDTGMSGSEQADGLLAGSAPLEVPSDLRERVLTTLAGSAERTLLSPPAPAQTGAALARTGADVVAYLLDRPGDAAGCAILIPDAALSATAGPQVVPLPMLGLAADGTIGEHAAAHESVLALPAPPASSKGAEYKHWQRAQDLAADRWRRSLEVLCAWAWPAVIQPLLAHVRQWNLDRPPRLVLIPVGRLSLVPWHAAVSPPDRAGNVRRACAEAVMSYAASCRQLIEVSRRPALSLQAAPVIVGNPTLDLTFAGLEAQAIRSKCYPTGRYLGYADPLTDGAADGKGLPSEVLELLPTADSPGASMLHLGCHADVAGSAPGRSFLLLAGGEKLMIEEILRRANGRPSRAPGGLVSLAACRSDLAAEEFDEALTLATAFLAGGAVTVVGARWELPDDSTSLMMFMFHHFMTACGHSPRDALRLAQLWMLDPDRVVPAEMPASLAQDASRADLADVLAWAGLTHQGQ